MSSLGGKTPSRAIRDQIGRNHDGKFGLTIYRCVYGDDEKWSRFVERLTAHANAALDRDTDGQAIKHLLDWNIQDNEAELNGLSKNEIRRYVLITICLVR